MKSFAHHNARTVMEASKRLAQKKGKAKAYAGGTDLLGILKNRILAEYPEEMINLKTIKGLDKIKEFKNRISIGALVKLSDIANSPVIKKDYKLLAEAAKSVASPNIRNMATIGGNLCQDVRCWYYRYPEQTGGPIICLRKTGKICNALTGDNRYHSIFGAAPPGLKKSSQHSFKYGCLAVNPSDTGTALAALDASIVTNKRTLSILDFFKATAVSLNILRPDEIITEIKLSKPAKEARQTFSKFTLRKPIDFAIVSVASVIKLNNGICNDARIVLGAVAPSPLRLAEAEKFLKGKFIDEAVAEKAGELAVEKAVPLSGNEYKIQIARSLVKRAVLGT